MRINDIVDVTERLGDKYSDSLIVGVRVMAIMSALLHRQSALLATPETHFGDRLLKAAHIKQVMINAYYSLLKLEEEQDDHLSKM